MLQITLMQVGKTTDTYLDTGIATYRKRLQSFVQTEIIEIPYIKNSKNLSVAQQKELEGVEILKKLPESRAYIVLLDESGKLLTSVQFANFIEKQTVKGNSQIVFVIGGAYGFSQKVYQRADIKLSLSPMTFSHQLIRIIFWEQIYRAIAILNNNPYHHA